MAATRTRRTLTPRNLAEDIVRGLAPLGAGQERVDREKKIIKGVKVLGRASINGRRYTAEAIEEAYKKRLYEGIAVYVNHPDKPNDPRAVSEKFGRVVNVRMMEGELYGDLEYLESNKDSALICEMAERMDGQLGCSHNAIGEGEDDPDGIFVVRHITEVRSVDLVTEPATTKGLFEHREKPTVALKIRQLFQDSWKKYARRVTKRPRLAGMMKSLIEQDEEDLMDEDVPPAADEVPADHEEALADGFEAAIMAIWKKYKEGDAEAAEVVKQIAKLIKAHDKLTNGADREDEDLEEEDEEPPRKEEAEEQRRRLARLERENLIHREAGKLGVTPDEVLMESLLDARDDKRVKKLLEREKERGGKSGNPPRSGGGGPEAKTVLEGVDTPEGFLAALLG